MITTKICLVCGEEFTSGNLGKKRHPDADRAANSKYCSEDCLNVMRRRKHDEKAEEYARAYRERHPEKIAAASRKHLQSEKGREAKRAYESRDYVRLNRQLKEERRTWGDRWDALVHYSGPHPFCACCGEDHPYFLCVDHINGKGNEHRRLNQIKNLPRWLKKNGYPEGFQVLCANCNSAKAWHGECPHETLRRLQEEVNNPPPST